MVLESSGSVAVLTEFRSDADLTVANVFVVPINGGVDNPNLNFTGERGNLDTQSNIGCLLHRRRYTGDLGGGPSARQWLLTVHGRPAERPADGQRAALH